MDYKEGTKITTTFLVKEGLLENPKQEYKIVAGRKFNLNLIFEVTNMTEGAKKQAHLKTEPDKNNN